MPVNSITSWNKLNFNGSQERIMKYDVTVVGRGPGGLMAVRTAAENSLKVLLIERKKKLETMIASYLSSRQHYIQRTRFPS